MDRVTRVSNETTHPAFKDILNYSVDHGADIPLKGVVRNLKAIFITLIKEEPLYGALSKLHC